MAIRVAVAGSTGKLGPSLLRALLAAGFELVVLTRKGSRSTDALPGHERQSIISVDYIDVKSLAVALNGVEAVVSTLSSSGLDSQRRLIDACVVAGVRRFIPSEFALDLHNPKVRSLPVYPGKIATQEYINGTAAANTDFTYTYLYTSIWLDWSINADSILNKGTHGHDLGRKAVVAIIKHQDATKNRAVYIHDVAITLNEILEVIKSIDGMMRYTQERSTADEQRSALQELSKPTPTVSYAHSSFLYVCLFSRVYGPDFTDKLDNALLGISELRKDEVVEILREVLATD